MKKTSLFAALIGAVMMFASCEKEITTTEVKIDESQTATLKLFVKADVDFTKVGYEDAPNDTELNISVRYDHINPVYSGQGRWKETVKVSNGVVEVTVPANDNGVTVYIVANDFEAITELNDTVDVLNRYYYSSSISGIKAGTNNVRQIYISSEEIERID